MLNIVIVVILVSIILIGVVHYNLQRIQIELPKQEITIKMNKNIKKQFEELNCSENEKLCLNKYKQWLKNNSHRLQDIVHVDNYRTLFGQAPVTSVKELIKYSTAFPNIMNNSPLIQNNSLPSPQKI